jgi:4,5-DOPA dioxygenase extradiol
MNPQDLVRNFAEASDAGVEMPALFIGHGSPMNAIEDNEFSRAWIKAAQTLPTPKAILCISAHWETVGTQATAMERPRTIYDFYGFPPALFRVRYAPPGAPDLAHLIQSNIQKTSIGLDMDWGLDHGAWSILSRMFPQADVPVIQLSLDRAKDPMFHYELGKELKALRKKGVLIVGSGNIVHNLREIVWQDMAHDWAMEFDEQIKQLILSGNHDAIIHYQKLGNAARQSVPTNEHYLPLLYVLALQDKEDEIGFFAEKVTLGSMSMRSFRIGG